LREKSIGSQRDLRHALLVRSFVEASRMTMRPIILFDVMETLVSEPFFTVMPRFFGVDDVNELKAQMHPSSWVEFEYGRITEVEYYQQFFRDGRPVDAERLRACLRDAYCWLEGMEQLARELHHRGYQMHALSNYSTWYEIIEDKLQVSRYVAWTFVSCETGVRKPDPDAYLVPARTLQVEPGDCLFIDDRPVNVEAARAVGMDAIVKTDIHDLRRQLAERGLVPG
jgi:HAD superfamily hydrolase (TIGR01509 family)